MELVEILMKLCFLKTRITKSKLPNTSNFQLIEIKKFDEVEKLIIDISPDQIYHLSGPSSVYESIKIQKIKIS